MPCKDGDPQEFELQDARAKWTKDNFPKARVLEYRITDAVPYAKIVHDRMVSNPEDFVRYRNGTICTMPAEHQTNATKYDCSFDIRAAAYDWRQG
eukprot:gene3449-11255_t